MFITTLEPDYTNYPSYVLLNGLLLPLDVIIGVDGEKIIAESKILDGVAVFERVSRKPFEISFEFNVRELKEVQRLLGVGKVYTFPQKTVEEILNNIWNIDAVITVQNSYLNGLGINSLIIKQITLATIRGNTDVPGSLKCLENYVSSNTQGSTLIINETTF